MAELHDGFPSTYIYFAGRLLVYFAHSPLVCSRAVSYLPKSPRVFTCGVRNECTHANCLGRDFVQGLEVTGTLSQLRQPFPLHLYQFLPYPPCKVTDTTRISGMKLRLQSPSIGLCYAPVFLQQVPFFFADVRISLYRMAGTSLANLLLAPDAKDWCTTDCH